MKLNKGFIQIMVTRAVKTMAQVAVSMITVGSAMGEINWVNIASIAAVAGVTSVLTTIATGIDNETAGNDGQLMIDNSGDHPVWRLALDSDLENIEHKRMIKLMIDPAADLSKPPFSQE